MTRVGPESKIHSPDVNDSVEPQLRRYPVACTCAEMFHLSINPIIISLLCLMLPKSYCTRVTCKYRTGLMMYTSHAIYPPSCYSKLIYGINTYDIQSPSLKTILKTSTTTSSTSGISSSKLCSTASFGMIEDANKDQSLHDSIDRSLKIRPSIDDIERQVDPTN